MEDAVTVAPPGWLGGEYAFFAVYDGHGGPAVAESCSERLHVYLEKHVDKARKLGYGEEKCKFEWDKVLKDCFSEMDGFIGANDESKETMMGSTAVVVILGNEEVVVANCGDSRVVLCRGGVPVPLSCDHKVGELVSMLVMNYSKIKIITTFHTSQQIRIFTYFFTYLHIGSCSVSMFKCLCSSRLYITWIWLNSLKDQMK